jgi:prepilin-type N-terminal cleavage/methylation domain-containing protein
VKQLFRRAHAAFTLIELLVVIAIIAILAAILFPVFAQAREKARQATCLSNLKQLGTATQMYMQDYEGSYPLAWWPAPADYGFDYALFPYVKNLGVYNCPSNETVKRSWPTWANPLVRYPGSYTTNSAISSPNGTRVAVNETQIQFPSSTIWLTEIRDTRKASNQGPEHEIFIGDNYRKVDVCARVPFDLHNRGFVSAYADGHAKWQKIDQSWKQWFLDNKEIVGNFRPDCNPYIPTNYQ